VRRQTTRGVEGAQGAPPSPLALELGGAGAMAVSGVVLELELLQSALFFAPWQCSVRGRALGNLGEADLRRSNPFGEGGGLFKNSALECFCV